MASASTSDRLAAVRAAIDAIVVSGQESTTVLGQSYKRADLSELRALEQQLVGELAIQTALSTDQTAGFMNVGIGRCP